MMRFFLIASCSRAGSAKWESSARSKLLLSHRLKLKTGFHFLARCSRARGAQIETTIWLALRQTIRSMPERFAQVRWRNRSDHGLAFVQAFRLDELAAHAKPLQPSADQPSLAATEFASQLLAHANSWSLRA